jgi:hypothetical protein
LRETRIPRASPFVQQLPKRPSRFTAFRESRAGIGRGHTGMHVAWQSSNQREKILMKTLIHIGFQSARILGVVSLIAGCAVSTEPSGHKGEEAVRSVAPAAAAESTSAVTVEKPESKKLLATIHRSDTHVIEFWEHTGGAVQVLETGDIDVDLHDEASLRGSLLRNNIAGMSLVDSYKLLAGAASDEAAIATLAEVDGRLGRLTPVPLQGGENGSTGMPYTSGGPTNQSGFRPLTPTQCQLTTDSWDWANDIAWFKNTFCGNNSTTCFANANNWWVAASEWYTYQNSWFDATGFEGSFCDSATFFYTIKTTDCDSNTVIRPEVFNLPPRNFVTQNWSTGGCIFRADWDAEVDGNWSGLDWQLRLGLAVHHK